MKITKVESIPYGIPVKGFADAYTSFPNSNAVLVLEKHVLGNLNFIVNLLNPYML